MARKLDIFKADMPAKSVKILLVGTSEAPGVMTTSDSEIEMQTIDRPQSPAPSALPVRQYHLFDRIVEQYLKYLRVVCKLGALPFEVDVENRQVFPTKSTIRWYLFYFIRFACLVKGLYVAVTLIASLLNPDWLQVLHLSLHVGMTFITIAFPLYTFRPKALRLSTVILNAALEKRDRVKSVSRQQLIAAVAPIGITMIGGILSLVFPLLTTILYQFGTLLKAAATEWEPEPLTFGLLRVAAYGLDAFPILWITVGIVESVMSQVLILEVLHSWCDGLQNKTNRSSLGDCNGEMVNIQIIIVFFNHIYKEEVFLNKLCCLSTGILGFVLVFRYGFSDHFILGVVNLYVGIVCFMLYPLIFEKAALISGSMRKAKKSLLMATADLEDETERAFWRRRIKAIQVAYIMCGPRPVERESLPLFYEFFVSTFIDVLLTA